MEGDFIVCHPVVLLIGLWHVLYILWCLDYASDPLQSGGPYTAILAKATTPSVPVIGSWSSGLFTRLDTPTVRAGVQPSGPAAVASVPPVPSGYYDNYLLGDTTATSSAITHVNNLEAYYYYQTCVNNACYLANRASAYAAYESSRGNAELAHAHWHEAQTQWTSQVFYQGGAYVAGNRMLQDEAWMRETGSPTSILSALPSSSLVSSYNPVSESGFPQQPPMALRNMSSSLVAKPLYHIQYVPEAIPTSLPTVHTNGDGTPVNVSHGALPIESRGVFIQNLHYEASSFHISNLLQQAGAVERCTVNARGTATATFRTAEEANMAVCLFDGAVFMGRTIRVRLDREVNPVTY